MLLQLKTSKHIGSTKKKLVNNNNKLVLLYFGNTMKARLYSLASLINFKYMTNNMKNYTIVLYLIVRTHISSRKPSQ